MAGPQGRQQAAPCAVGQQIMGLAINFIYVERVPPDATQGRRDAVGTGSGPGKQVHCERALAWTLKRQGLDRKIDDRAHTECLRVVAHTG